MKQRLLTAVTCAVAGVSSVADTEDSAEPIGLVTNDWGSQLVVSHITGTLLEDMGFSVQYHPADTRQQFVGLAMATCTYRWTCGKVPWSPRLPNRWRVSASLMQARTPS